eukprot:PhM_4_TR3312/c0_g1_i1/m.61105
MSQYPQQGGGGDINSAQATASRPRTHRELLTAAEDVNGRGSAVFEMPGGPSSSSSSGNGVGLLNIMSNRSCLALLGVLLIFSYLVATSGSSSRGNRMAPSQDLLSVRAHAHYSKPRAQPVAFVALPHMPTRGMSSANVKKIMESVAAVVQSRAVSFVVVPPAMGVAMWAPQSQPWLPRVLMEIPWYGTGVSDSSTYFSEIVHVAVPTKSALEIVFASSNEAQFSTTWLQNTLSVSLAPVRVVVGPPREAFDAAPLNQRDSGVGLYIAGDATSARLRNVTGTSMTYVANGPCGARDDGPGVKGLKGSACVTFSLHFVTSPGSPYSLASESYDVVL